jgi:hypothetical protein
MRWLLVLALLLPCGGYAQTPPPPPVRPPLAPPPNDPLEPITGDATQAVTVEQHAALVKLINHAAEQYQLHVKSTPAHILQVAFTATGSTLFPAGAGQLRETWASGQNWRWEATLGDYSLLRVSSDGVAYDQQKPAPLPLRLKMLANSIFNPLQPAPRASLRAANLTWKGTAVTCILRSFGGDGPAIVTATIGRQWNETEYCIDPATGLLMMLSEVPGIYVNYDYTNALRFHDRVLPGALTIMENGAPVIQAQLTSLVDTSSTNLTPFTPTAQMKAQGPAMALMTPMNMVQVAYSPDVTAGSPVQTSVVHLTFDDQGTPQEIESLQNSPLSAAAIEAVSKQKMFAGMQRAAGTAPMQREAYIRVEFFPQRRQPAGWNFVHQPN